MKHNNWAFLFFVLYASCAQALSEKTCTKYNLGWHFYCEKPKEEIAAEASLPVTPKEQLTAIQQKLDDLRITAVMQPTQENIVAYVTFQQEQLERASHFSDAWSKMLWQRPDLDLTISSPVSSVGKQAWMDTRQEEIRKALLSLHERYGIFFVYSSTCPYCHRYSPILKSMQNSYQLSIFPISKDGGILPEWPESVKNTGQLGVLGLEDSPVPATLLFDKVSGQVTQVGYGILSESELAERLYTLTKVGDDHAH